MFWLARCCFIVENVKMFSPVVDRTTCFFLFFQKAIIESELMVRWWQRLSLLLFFLCLYSQPLCGSIFQTLLQNLAVSRVWIWYISKRVFCERNLREKKRKGSSAASFSCTLYVVVSVLVSFVWECKFEDLQTPREDNCRAPDYCGQMHLISVT